MLVPYRAQSINYAAGPYDLNLSALPRTGPRGLRNVIQRIDIWADTRIDTGAGVTLAQRDLPGIVKELEVFDSAGYRVKLLGGMLPIFYQMELGARAPKLPAAIAANTPDQDRDIFLSVTFARPNDFAPDDCGIPVDDLLPDSGGGITLHMPADADLDWAGGTGVIDAVTKYKFRFWLREERDVQYKSRDIRSYTPQRAADVLELNGKAGLLRYIGLWSKAAGGGTDLAGLVDFTCEQLRVSSIEREALKAAYLAAHDMPADYANEDLVYNDRVIPLFWPERHSKMRDYPRIDGQLVGSFNTAESAAKQVYHMIRPKDPEMMARAAGLNGVAGAPVTVKTYGKTRRDPKGWGQDVAYMPLKAVGG